MARAQRRAVAARGGDRGVRERQGERGAVGVGGVGDRDPPGRAAGAGPESPRLAEVEQDVGEARGAQQVGDTVRDVALGDAVQRQRHAGTPEGDPLGRRLHRAEADPAQRGGERLGRRLGRGAGEEVPERLDARVERAAGGPPQRGADGQQLDQLGRRRVEGAIAVQADEDRVVAVQAEDPLEPGHLGETAREHRVGERGVGAGQDHAGLGPQHHPVPPAQRDGGRGARGGKQRQAAAERGGDQDAASGPGPAHAHFSAPAAPASAPAAASPPPGPSPPRM